MLYNNSAMEMLTKETREATRAKFEAGLAGPVKIILFIQEAKRLLLLGSLKGQDCFFCKETRLLLEEVAALSDKIELQVLDIKADAEKAAEFGIDKVPGIVLMGKSDPGIRIYGIPSGYEYSTLIEDIVDISRGTTQLSEKTKEAIKSIDKDIRIQVFITPTCVYCSSVVRLAHQFALQSPFIRAEMIESTEFQDLSNRYNVYGVPKTIVNETISFEGAVPEDEFLANVLKSIKQLESTN
jgi:glutaredoxin-like protein